MFKRIFKNQADFKLFSISWFILFVIYCGLILVEGLFFDGDFYVAIVSFGAGSILFVSVMIFYFVYPHRFWLPLYIVLSSQLTFLVVGAYLHELEFYFLVMLLLVCCVSMLKNLKVLVVCVLTMSLMNIFAIALFLLQMEWLGNVRFIMSFMMFIFGSVFFIIHTRNVTQKERRADQAFAAFSSLLVNTPNYMIIIDPLTRVRYISDPMLNLTNYKHREFAVGQPLIDLFHDKALKLMFADILSEGGFYESVVKINVAGSERHFKIVSDKLEGAENGKFIDIADITETVESGKAAERASKAKSDFLATMSHEIRTPMNAIIGITQIQMQADNLTHEYRQVLEKIWNAGNSLLGIINDILDMSKIEAGKLELSPSNYDVPSLINDAVQLNIIRIGSKPIEFILEVDENLPSRFIGDELRIKQILSNLLSNGIKYTDSGYVRLTVSHTAQDEYSMLRFVVEDTGQGMKPEDLSSLFLEYQRFNSEANRTTEGTGLGMNITEKLVKMMDGSISVTSEHGKGSVFTVEVKQKIVICPVIGPELSERLRSFAFVGGGGQSITQISRTPMPYGRVLIVDDVETNLYVARGLLTPYKLACETAISGFAAIEMVESGSRYDIIFMDHMMPIMDGIETTKKLRENGYDGVIVALTANALAGNDEMFLKNGFDGFISKPVDIRHLDHVLSKFIRDKYPAEAAKYKSETSSAINTLEAAKKPSPELLKVFCRDAKKAVTVLRKTVSDGDIKLFTTTAHAMKSALANIGASEESERAAKLEDAGIKNDMEFILKGTEQFAQMLEKLADELDVQTGVGDDSVQEDTRFLKEQLLIIKNACENYDDTTAYAAFDMLLIEHWSCSTTDALKDIRDMLFLRSDFDGAGAAAGEWEGKLKP